MRKLIVDQLEPGMVLARSIDNERGDSLLAKGVSLTQQYIDALKELGYHSIYVKDGIADDVEPPRVLSPIIRDITYRHLKDLFTVLENATAEAKTDAERKEIIEQITTSIKPQFAELRKDVEQIVDEVVSADTISGIVSLKSHDNYTFEHSIEVTVVAILLGKRLCLTISELHQLALGCLFHDIGKLVVPRTLLGKPGRLTDEEFAVIQRHPQAGFDAVQHLMGQSDIIARHIVRQHHERQDGKGYPRGLRGTNHFTAVRPTFGQGLILPSAEIAAVADVYSAIASDRPYRPAMHPQQVIVTMRQMAGTHLNRDVVAKFMTILPAFPIGTDVIIVAGRLRGYRGIVTEMKPLDINAPVVRLLYDSRGRTIAPIDVDTSDEEGIVLAAIPLELLELRQSPVPAPPRKAQALERKRRD